MTWNVLSGRDEAHSNVDLEAVAAAIAALDADVVALQELDRQLPRTGEVDQLACVARHLGWFSIFAPALLGEPGGEWTAATDGDPGGPAYGIGLLTRQAPLRWRRLRLPGGGRAPRHRRRGGHAAWDAEPRVAIQAELAVGAGTASVTATHLSYMPWRGARQLRALLAAAGQRRPALLAGDFNLPPWAVRGLTPGWASAGGDATYPAHEPRIQVDHILGRGARPGPARTQRFPVSDHVALLSDVTLRA